MKLPLVWVGVSKESQKYKFPIEPLYTSQNNKKKIKKQIGIFCFS